MSFVLCEICLTPAEPWRLKSRDLSAFYALHPTAFEGIPLDTPAWLCAFCWTRVCQCVHFIDTAITSRIFLSTKNRLAAIPSTDVHTYVVESLPHWQVGLKLRKERKEKIIKPKEPKIKTKTKGKQRKSDKIQPNDPATNILKDELSKDLETAIIDLNSSSECLSSFDHDVVLTRNSLIQECRDHSSGDSLINDELAVLYLKETIQKPVEKENVRSNCDDLDVVHLDEIIQKPVKKEDGRSNCDELGVVHLEEIIQKPVEKENGRSNNDELGVVHPEKNVQKALVKENGRSNFPIKETGETEFLRFLESKQKPGKVEKIRYSVSSIFDNIFPPSRVREYCDYDQYVNYKLKFKEVAFSSKDVGAKMSKKGRNKRKNEEIIPEFKHQAAALKKPTAPAINERPVEDIQMLLDEIKEPFYTFPISETIKSNLIFDDAEAASEEIGGELSIERKNIKEKGDKVSGFKEKLEAPTNIEFSNINGKHIEDIQMLIEEVKEEPFEALNMSDNNSASIIFEGAAASSKEALAKLRTVDNKGEVIENGDAAEKIPVWCINQRPVEHKSFHNTQLPNSLHVYATANDMY